MYEALKIVYNPETKNHEVWCYGSFYEKDPSDVKWDWLPWFDIETCEDWDKVLINAIETIQKNNRRES